MTLRIRLPAAISAVALLVAAGILSSADGPVCSPRQEGAGKTYYVAMNGDDSFNGLAPSPEKGGRGPFRTLSRAARAVGAGETVMIRAGTYREASRWYKEGTEADPITITSYAGESVIISGNGHSIPEGAYGTLVSIKGDWINISDLRIEESSWYGLVVEGDHCTVDNISVHRNWGSGIFTTGWHNLIADCLARNNSLVNEKFRSHEGGWGFGISACRYPRHTTIRGCVAWDNWGEGISTFESYDITIEDCISYNNQQNFYISDTKHCLFQRNLSYYTPGNAIQGYVTQCAILMGNEGRAPACSDNTIINNLCLGGERNIAIGTNTFENGLVAHNTFVNASDTGGKGSANVWINRGTYRNARFVNNIVFQEDRVAIARVDVRGVMFSHNNWSKRPARTCRGRGDVIKDPRLLKSGRLGSGQLRPEWFKILADSPVKDRGQTIGEVVEDYFKTPRRGAPDIGAHELLSPPHRLSLR